MRRVQPGIATAPAEAGHSEPARVSAVAGAQAAVASRSDSICASGARRMTSRKICAGSVIFDRSASRAYSSGATAWYPALASRRQVSLMYSWTPKISSMTRTVGKGPAPGRLRGVARQMTPGDRDLDLAGVEPRGVGMDRLRVHPRRREGEAADQACHHEPAPGQRVTPQSGKLRRVAHRAARAQCRAIARFRFSSILPRKACVFIQGWSGPISDGQVLGHEAALHRFDADPLQRIGERRVTSGVSSKRPR